MFLQANISEKITSVLGEYISTEELQSCLEAAEIIEVPAAKLFWQLTEATKGLYIVLEGKIRLLDYSENLITTLSGGASFGEATLFEEQEFIHYAVRASHNLKLGFLKQETLQHLIDKYPIIRQKLLITAENWDLILLCLTNSNFPHHSSQVPGLMEALSLFEKHSLQVSEKIAAPKDCLLWLLHRGEIRNSDGDTLRLGQIYAYNKQDKLKVEQPTIAYFLDRANLQTALEHCPELAEFINGESEISHKIALDRQPPRRRSSLEPLHSNNKIIPFPGANKQAEANNKASKKKASRIYFPSPKVKIGHWWGHLTKRYPYYAQQSASDCGAACLVMIGRYWGKHFSVSRLRDITNAGRSGASLRALASAAESVGFATRPVKATLEKFAEQSFPAIAHWEGNHFIVVYRVTSTHVIVGDPARGQCTLTRKEFNAGWSGYALLLQATSLLKDAENQDVGLWKFFELVKPHYKVLIEVFIASVIMQLFGLVTPIFTQLLLDRVLVQRSIPTLNAVGVGMIVFGLFSIAMNGVRSYLLTHTANRISVSLLVGFIKHTFRLPLSYFESRYVGDIISRIKENQKIQSFLTGQTLSIVLDMLTLVVYLTLMFSYSWKMALFVLITVPPFFILALASTGILRRISREIFNAGAEESSYIIESLTGIRTVRSLAIEQTVRWRWEELLNNRVKKSFNAKVIGIRLNMLSSAIQTFTSTGLMWFGAWQVIQGELTVGQLVAFNMLVGKVLGPFQRFSQLWNQFQEIIISTERLNDVLEAEPEEDLQNKPRKSLDRLNGHIRFDNVTFRYHAESKANILENISFEIKPDQMVALVGRSGSGKTTLSKLILGLYPPTDGKVLIDNQDINGIALQSLRSQVGVVDQDTFLFGGTIRENIAIAHPEATLDEVIQAAQLAGADEFIRLLPLGYETHIGEGGGLLSGGQRQRLAIARALLGNPRLLLFDEATSHLDTESERIIQNNLRTILKGRTSVIIAHRLSTVRNADLIMVMDKGVLVESGSHDELIALKGHYYYLNQQQLAQAG
ncbi:ABC-type bacteriocin/lantibiotic exporter with N-terminal double-glycine peptidase domain [Rivularia sp. PCC 7116]|uniref:peptidase domain-containing ABC transporter n=1 Tax=Rivularia sp. PCC 7116 TaxID=373994 RepID=UPI00029EDD93|nr:peptidase domain-containing ABC transporter [Rivularia sp. PCC 7116]AFY52987.1 ABC-type bacteriocin/lantibiotic exporter with N-terminal double-glycine peptidase domain [Rivularia sp. PCC 7116]